MVEPWVTFLVTVAATFLGVFLSFGLFRLWDHYSEQREKVTIKRVILQEVVVNKVQLNVIHNHLEEGGPAITGALLLTHVPLKTNAYSAAFQAGKLSRIGDINLEQKLGEYAFSCELYERFIEFRKYVLIRDYSVIEKAPLELLQLIYDDQRNRIEALLGLCGELEKLLL